MHVSRAVALAEPFTHTGGHAGRPRLSAYRRQWLYWMSALASLPAVGSQRTYEATDAWEEVAFAA